MEFKHVQNSCQNEGSFNIAKMGLQFIIVQKLITAEWVTENKII